MTATAERDDTRTAMAMEWLRGYLLARGGVADHFEVIRAAQDVDVSWDSTVLRYAIWQLGGRDGCRAWGERWVFELHPSRSKRPAGGCSR